MKVQRVKNVDDFYDFYLIQDKKVLKIFLSNDLNLNMSISNGNLLKENDSLSFTIKESDQRVFDLFDLLYKDIITANVFGNGKSFFITSKEYSNLVDDDFNINWESDDNQAHMMIKRVNNTYQLIFKKKKVTNYDEHPLTINVKFDNVNSNYKPFNFIFVRLLTNLNCLFYDQDSKIKKKKK